MKLYSRDELKDSRIFFDKEPPRFGTYFVIFVGLLIVGALLASTIINKTYIVKAQGTVVDANAQYVSSNVNGMIVEVNKEEGEFVNEGDILLVVSNGTETLQGKSLREQLDLAYEKIDAMDKYQKSLENRINYMVNNGVEQEYYGYMEYYLQQVISEDYSTNTQLNDIKKKENRVSILNSDISNLNTEIERLKTENNQAKLKTAQNKLNELESKQIQFEQKLSLETDENVIKNIEQEINDIKKDINSTKTQIDLFNEKIETLSVKKSDLESKKSELLSSEEELASLKEQMGNPINQVDQMKSQLLMELGKNRSQIETQIIELESNIQASIDQIDTYQIKANQDGIIHYVSPLRVGVAVQQNQVLVDISSQSTTQLIVDAYINAQDRSKIAINDNVNIAINGVNTTKYGTLDGKVTFIDSGTIAQETQQGSMLLYRVKISIDEYKLKSNDDQINVVTSMPVEARIVYEKESYFDWILNMLNFKS